MIYALPVSVVCNREVEIVVWVWLIVERVVPPFVSVVGETVLLHHFFEQHAIFVVGFIDISSRVWPHERRV